MVLDHLSGIADLSLAVERGDFATAERLGIEFGEDLRLMEDLGWDSEPRKDADLTMAPEDLAEVLTRLKGDAEGGLGDSAYGRDASTLTWRRPSGHAGRSASSPTRRRWSSTS